MTRKPDMVTTRWGTETAQYGREQINKELRDAGIIAESIERGSTQPNGKAIYYIYLKN